MEKTIYNESNGLWYELQGDYYIPCLTVPAEEEKPIGIWGAAASAVHKAGAKSSLHGTADQRQAEYIPCRHQRTGNGTNAPADRANGRTCGGHRTAQSAGSNAVGTADE